MDEHTHEYRMFMEAKKRAQRFGLPFTITLDDIVIPAVCPALGIPLQKQGPRSQGSPALDRLRPDQGYVPGNVLVISDLANRIKNNATSQQVRAVGEWMRSHAV